MSADSKPTTIEPIAPGDAYLGGDGTLTCALCDSEMDWQDCSFCGGDGFFDDDDDGDPTCPQCAGSGGDNWCPTHKCRTLICKKVIPTPDRR